MSMEKGGIIPASQKIEKVSREKPHTGEWSIVTDRGFTEYIRSLGLSYSELKDKKVLDVGSGLRERFSREAAEKLGTHVFSVNPKLDKWIYRKILKYRNSEWQRKSVAAAAEELPFPDNTFDTATSLYAISLYLDSDQQFRAIKEIVRTLKPGGKIHMAPRYEDEPSNPEDYMYGLNPQTIEWLKKNGHSVEFGSLGQQIIITKNFNPENKI